MEQLKFQDMHTTAKGEQRASVKLNKLSTLWFNTGTLCNLECKNCYIESSPKNDRLSYLSVSDIIPYLDEVEGLPSIGFTGGEPFLNPSIIGLLEEVLKRGHELLVLTNANRVIKKHRPELLRLKELFGHKLKLRVSLDHFSKELHDQERGAGAFDRTLDELKWLFDHGFDLSIASRSLSKESQEESLLGHQELLLNAKINIDLNDKLVIFPEMDSKRDVPEITTACWGILNKSPDDQMCASERMIVKRKGEASPVVMPCTLLAYDDKFVLGKTLSESSKEVYLNHRFCAEFCVLGGASCSKTK
ncbi:radical SAM protein [Bacteriovorax sp. Seq25_V]|uniref:radical SAM protein n=1 Tax=Bacteriovorax sp. Seq25_V TaxID=1201288 RepID=UPI00038A283B|nr:radical SAM protein [Bacteriovorax sp. Seq25_V]EQC47398.1 radical SAM domain protein [Bacteriovorax sp. Seq25_V]